MKKVKVARQFDNKLVLVFVAVFVVIGLATLALSFAGIASNAKAGEGESVSQSTNVVTLTDGSASNSSFLEFRAAPPDPICEDPAANNSGGSLPCTYDPDPDPDPVCEDPSANNTGGSLPCTYDDPTPDPNLRPIPDSEVDNYTVSSNVPPFNAAHGEPKQGDFRLHCHFSHLGYNDPIVFPGQENASHLHMFWGNTLADHNSTTESLLGSGDSTCGGPLNRTAYWAPALHQPDGQVRVPSFITVYYKANGTDQPWGKTVIPEGLRMITDEYRWICNGSGFGSSDRLGNCNGGLQATVVFQACWDGVNLDSPDHRSHMAQAIYGGGWGPCPEGYPVRIPTITQNIHWENVNVNSNWYLSSDRHNGANETSGTTLHMDWFGAWQPSILERWTNECIIAFRNCQVGGTTSNNGQLGDGTALSQQKNYGGPYVLPEPSIAFVPESGESLSERLASLATTATNRLGAL